MNDQLWSPQELAAFLGMPVKTVYEWRHKGEGPVGYRIGRHVRYDPGEIRRWLESRRDDDRSPRGGRP